MSVRETRPPPPSLTVCAPPPLCQESQSAGSGGGGAKGRPNFLSGYIRESEEEGGGVGGRGLGFNFIYYLCHSASLSGIGMNKLK